MKAGMSYIAIERCGYAAFTMHRPPFLSTYLKDVVVKHITRMSWNINSTLLRTSTLILNVVAQKDSRPGVRRILTVRLVAERAHRIGDRENCYR